MGQVESEVTEEVWLLHWFVLATSSGEMVLYLGHLNMQPKVPTRVSFELLIFVFSQDDLLSNMLSVHLLFDKNLFLIIFYDMAVGRISVLCLRA